MFIIFGYCLAAVVLVGKTALAAVALRLFSHPGSRVEKNGSQ